MHKLLIATNNQGKIEELHDLLRDMDIELVIPSQIGLDLDVIEDGHTYAENAIKKAVAFAHASGLISLADDSGLEMDALGSAPGLYSARYGSLPLNSQNLGGAGGERLSDSERRQYLLGKLQGKPRPWTAHFHATIAIAIPKDHVTLRGVKSLLSREETLQSLRSLRVTDTKVYLAEGICPGEIIPEERGAGGFGYDPIFLLTELGKTMAELSMNEKNHLSHRAKAVMNAKEILKILLENG